MHPVGNIHATASSHLEGRRIVLAVAGSIAAVKTIELARELIRHGAEVIPVMSDAATRILHPDALEFATGNAPITRLTGQVEHVSLLGQVAGRADLLLVAPATGNTVAKLALGIDDGPVTTCATVAFGSGVPVVIAPAMHEVMLDQPILAEHRKTLVDKLKVTWVEPLREEFKAKLADVDDIVEAVIHRLAASDPGGPLAGQRALVISGATVEPIDPVRILTNRSSGRSGLLIARELHRLGADVTLWQGSSQLPIPSFLQVNCKRFDTHAQLVRLVKDNRFDVQQIWMPAAIGDYGTKSAPQKIPSERTQLAVQLRPLPKIIELVRKAAPKATLVAFKAESDEKNLLSAARARLQRYGAQFIVANEASAFGAEATTVHLVHAKGVETLSGPKHEVLPALVDLVALSAAPRATNAAKRKSTSKAKRGSKRKSVSKGRK